MNNICEKCGGECCQVSCGLIPTDLESILNYFGMTFKEFFKQYLTVYPYRGVYKNIVLVPYPREVYRENKINECFIEYEYNKKYPRNQKRCIFLDNGKCNIQDVKPYCGAKYECHWLTGGEEIKVSEADRIKYWEHSQDIFYQLSDEIKNTLNEINSIIVECHDDKERIYTLVYEDLRNAFNRLIK